MSDMDTGLTDRFGLNGAWLDGKYKIDQAVAAGGFGTIYRATHTGLARTVALKVLRLPESQSPEVQAAMIEMFRQEARTLAALEHPAIVRVIDFGASDMPSGVMAPWMALDWIEGAPLADELDARLGQGGRTPADTLTLLRPVLDALAYAHALGVAHRDIKPDNLMCLRDWKGQATLKILDFGIARSMTPEETAGSGETSTGALLAPHSPNYAAPEQLARARTGPWTDVHALGLVLTEVLTDTLAYDRPDELFACAVAHERPTPGSKGWDVGAWEPVIARALALRPSDRYPSAGALLDALERALPEARHLSPEQKDTDPIPSRRVRPPANAPTRRSVLWVAGVAIALVFSIALLAPFVGAIARKGRPAVILPSTPATALTIPTPPSQPSIPLPVTPAPVPVPTVTTPTLPTAPGPQVNRPIPGRRGRRNNNPVSTPGLLVAPAPPTPGTTNVSPPIVTPPPRPNPPSGQEHITVQ